MSRPFTDPFTLTAATPFKIFNMAEAPYPCTAWTQPAAGDTVVMSYSLDGGVNYTASTLGDVTSASTTKSLVFYSEVTHIKFQRTAGSGTTSTCGVC